MRITKIPEVLSALRCPHCGEPLAADGATLRCANSHAFDLARQGYVSLLRGDARTGTADTSAMIEARDAFLSAGHYAPIAEEAARMLGSALVDGPDGVIVEVGAGTGYYLAAALDALPTHAGVALDISKPALRRAVRSHDCIGAVACDVWSGLPLATDSAAAVLDVFSPRNVDEMARVLAPGGVLVVVTPNASHLRELITALGLLSVDDRKPERLDAQLSARFALLETAEVARTMQLSHAEVAALAGMGPSAWHTDAAALAAAIASLPDPAPVTQSVTVSAYRALIGVGLALLLAAGVGLAAPRAAFSAPASTVNTATIAAKKAQQEDIKRELDDMRARLAANVSEYVKVSRQLGQTRTEVDKLTAQIAEQDYQLEQAKLEFEQRAVEMYRSRGTAMIEILMTASSLQELMSRTNFLLMVSQRNANTITDYRKVRSESAWLQDSLSNRLDYLTKLQTEADDQRSKIESDLVTGEVRTTELGTDIARLMRGEATPITGGTPSDQFSPDTVISDANFRDAGSMTVGDIQTFLDRQPGILKSYRTSDHSGKVRFASEMIAEAAVAFRINPKVLIVKLQKEQSLLGDATPTQKQLDWATGCGRGDSYTSWQFKGFGNQVWWGAQKLDKNAKPWRPGIKMTIDGAAVYPTNEATYSLYKYTPHIRGTTSFWLLYWRYFGDPLV